MVGLLGMGAIAVLRTVSALGVGGGESGTMASDIGEAAIVFAAAVLILVFASLLRDQAAVRTWILLGTGTLAFAAGDALWVITYAVRGDVPYPGLPDIFYMLEYVFMGVALVMAGVSLRQRGAERSSAFLIAGLTGVVGLGVLFFGLMNPLLLAEGLSGTELAFNVLYPIADVLVLIMPAAFLLVLAASWGDKRVLVPWAVVGASVLFLAATDILYSWLMAYGVYTSGSVIDYGWVAAHVGLAVAASLALDAEAVPVRTWMPLDETSESSAQNGARTSIDAQPRFHAAASTRRGA